MSGDPACVDFLCWALPRLGLRWAGFRKVRGQVCRRLRRRVAALGLRDLDAYREHLGAHPEEWRVLDDLTPITISRFYRDRAVFEALELTVVPELAAGAAAAATRRPRLRAWSAGCASGEEPYTLALLWQCALRARFPTLALDVLATDRHPAMLERALRARYDAGSLRDLPAAWRERGFDAHGAGFVLRPAVRRLVRVERHDVREPPPAGPFDLVLCRNLAFTYFAAERQQAVLDGLADVLREGGALVVGLHETPPASPGLAAWGTRAVLRRVGAPASG